MMLQILFGTQNYDSQRLGQALSVEACWLVNLWLVSPALKCSVRSAAIYLEK